VSNLARVEPTLFGTPSFAISNSPMFVHPQQPRVEHGRVAVTYSFLIESFASYPQSVALARASLTIANRHPKLVCSVAGHALAELLLEPGGRYRIDCEIAFTFREVPLSSIGDATARLVIPMTLNGVSDQTQFVYFFRREDAS
jgi:hypothetical protein